VDKYQIIEKRLPIFATKGARKTRYYITDNFLLSWLGAIDRQIKAARVRPLDVCVKACGTKLETVEGMAFEKMVRLLIEELSRSGDKDFQITAGITGYWNRSEEVERSIEIDHISLNEDQGWVRFGSCKRSGEKLITEAPKFEAHVKAFMKTKEGRKLEHLQCKKIVFAPSLTKEQSIHLKQLGFESYGFDELLRRA
jgi:AAA+ ATPase superfamily predicted ATPase